MVSGSGLSTPLACSPPGSVWSDSKLHKTSLYFIVGANVFPRTGFLDRLNMVMTMPTFHLALCYKVSLFLFRYSQNPVLKRKDSCILKLKNELYVMCYNICTGTYNIVEAKWL